MQSEIDNLRSACVTMEISRDNVVRELTDEFGLKEVELKRVIADKDAVLARANKDLETLKTEVARLTEIQNEERQALTRSMSEREKNIQVRLTLAASGAFCGYGVGLGRG